LACDDDVCDGICDPEWEKNSHVKIATSPKAISPLRFRCRGRGFQEPLGIAIFCTGTGMEEGLEFDVDDKQIETSDPRNT